MLSCSTNWGCHIVTIDDNRSTVVTLVAGLRLTFPTLPPYPSLSRCCYCFLDLYIAYICVQPAHATHLRHRFVIKIVIAHNGFITLALSRYVFVSFLALSLYLRYLFRFCFGLHTVGGGGGKGGLELPLQHLRSAAGPHRVSQLGRKTNLVFRLPQRNKFNNIFGFPPFCFLFYLFFVLLCSFNVFLILLCTLIENPLEGF